MTGIAHCEQSQEVCEAFRALGWEFYSNDILPCSGGHPEWHIQGDAREVCFSRRWDLIIAFPPCTDLAVSGSRWFEEKKIAGRQKEAIEFFMFFTQLKGRVAIENPVGIMSTEYRKPDQIIQPWLYGHKATKATCLWLRNLPRLRPTDIVGPPKKYADMSKEELAEWTAIHRAPPRAAKIRIPLQNLFRDSLSHGRPVVQP